MLRVLTCHPVKSTIWRASCAHLKSNPRTKHVRTGLGWIAENYEQSLGPTQGKSNNLPGSAKPLAKGIPERAHVTVALAGSAELGNRPVERGAASRQGRPAGAESSLHPCECPRTMARAHSPVLAGRRIGWPTRQAPLPMTTIPHHTGSRCCSNNPHNLIVKLAQEAPMDMDDVAYAL